MEIGNLLSIGNWFLRFNYPHYTYIFFLNSIYETFYLHHACNSEILLITSLLLIIQLSCYLFICILFVSDESMFIPAVSIMFGIFLWSLIEYSLHRWVFHMEPSGNSEILIYVHFAIHGLHHKVKNCKKTASRVLKLKVVIFQVPFDSRRLVFPPFPAAVLAYVGYSIVSFVIPESVVILVLAGAILGMFCFCLQVGCLQFIIRYLHKFP